MTIQLKEIKNFGEKTDANIDRAVALDMVRVTEAAARAAARHAGRGDKNNVDGAAVAAMRRALNGLDINATVVIGEGDKDDAPELYVGEILGSEVGRKHGPALDIAVDPVDGTKLTANGLENALAVMAIAERGCFLQAPDIYMEKLVVGTGMDISAYSLDMPMKEILATAAKQKGVKQEELVVCTLDRPRHDYVVQGVREAGARVRLITDGDIAGGVACAVPESGIDLFIGTGGAPEGVVTAAALKCMGGDMLGRLNPHGSRDAEHALAEMEKLGMKDDGKTYTMNEMAQGEVIFLATGVTDGTMLKGVRRVKGGEMTQSVIMRSATGTIRWIDAFHKTD